MNADYFKKMAQSLKSLPNEAERDAFWAAQWEKINRLTPEQRMADLAAIRQRVAEIAWSLGKDQEHKLT
jgi:hypothetical protein